MNNNQPSDLENKGKHSRLHYRLCNFLWVLSFSNWFAYVGQMIKKSGCGFLGNPIFRIPCNVANKKSELAFFKKKKIAKKLES